MSLPERGPLRTQWPERMCTRGAAMMTGHTSPAVTVRPGVHALSNSRRSQP
jgi:hypothetical protein